MNTNKKIEKKGFHPVRHFRLSDENYEWILEEKKKNKGTWNYYFTKLIKKIK